MKKALIALAVLGAASGAAMAQSSVTLYGVADIALGKSTAVGDKKWGAQDGYVPGSLTNNGNSRIGFTGKEDLGGGLWAGFRFEGNVSLANGAFSGFSREANLMLGSKDFGTVKLGRSFSPSFDGIAVWELTGAANYSAVANTYGFGAYPDPRNHAQLEYQTPNISGFSAELAYIPQADGFLVANGVVNKTDRWDLNLAYAQGPLGVAFTVNKSNRTSAGTPGNKANFTVGGQYKIANTFALAASYNYAASLIANWDNNSHGAAVLGKRRGFSLGGSYFAGPFTVTLDLTRDTKHQIQGVNVKKRTNGVVEGKYSLSKRTFLYADYLRLDGYNNYGLGVRHNF